MRVAVKWLNKHVSNQSKSDLKQYQGELLSISFSVCMWYPLTIWFLPLNRYYGRIPFIKGILVHSINRFRHVFKIILQIQQLYFLRMKQ